MLHLITPLWISARPPLGYQLSLNSKQRALKLKKKGNAEMSACNSPVVVVTKDLLVLFPSPGSWPLAPITEQPVAVHTVPSIIYTFPWVTCIHPSVLPTFLHLLTPVCLPSPPPRPLYKPLLLPFSLQPSAVACAARPCTGARSCIITPTDAIPPSGSNQT